MNETAQISQTRKQAYPNIWEVLKYAIQIFFQYMQYWFLFNISYLGYSLAIITIPSAKISLTAAIWKGLENVDGIKKEDSRKMRDYLKENFLKSIQILLIKILVFGIIGFSIWFWISRPEKILHFVSILAIYGLFLVWMTNFYLYPILIEDQTRTVSQACKLAFKQAFTKPFESAFFSTLDFILLVVEIVLFGPLMFVLPSLRKILSVLGYWYTSNKDIPMVVREFQGIKFINSKE